MYNWNELKALWEHDRMTVEQVIGQLLVWSEHHRTVATTHQRRQEMLEHQVKTLTAQVAALQARLGRSPGQ